MNVENTMNPAIYKMAVRDRLKTQLATIVGVVVTIAVFVLVPVCLRLYKHLALFLGIWKEPPLVDALAMCLILPFVGSLIGAAVRGWLIYRWVAK